MAKIPTVAVSDGKGGQIIVNEADAPNYEPLAPAKPKAKAKAKAKPKAKIEVE